MERKILRTSVQSFVIVTVDDLLRIRIILVERGDHDCARFLKVDRQTAVPVVIVSDSLSRRDVNPRAICDEVLHHIASRSIPRTNAVCIRNIQCIFGGRKDAYRNISLSYEAEALNMKVSLPW